MPRLTHCPRFTLGRRRFLGLALAPLALGQPQTGTAQANSPQVMASFSILADMAREVAPDGVQVSALVGPDADAHVYEPGPADGRRLARAHLVVINGLGFEGWIDRMVRVSGYRGQIAVTSQGIAPRGGGHHGTDPHAWQDLRLARRYVANLREAFARRWPQQRAQIEARAADYTARIDALDARVRQWLAPVPRAERRVITAHDAFGYFGAAYGVDFLAPQAWGTHSEPSAAAVARLIRQIRAQGVRAVFLENISNARLIERIAQEAGARVGGTLYSDALSAPGGPASTYLQMFEHNARSLSAALQA
jgi:zinc/manganese transport system substrate-binding protein